MTNAEHVSFSKKWQPKRHPTESVEAQFPSTFFTTTWCRRWKRIRLARHFWAKGVISDEVSSWWRPLIRVGQAVSWLTWAFLRRCQYSARCLRSLVLGDSWDCQNEDSDGSAVLLWWIWFCVVMSAWCWTLSVFGIPISDCTSLGWDRAIAWESDCWSRHDPRNWEVTSAWTDLDMIIGNTFFFSFPFRILALPCPCLPRLAVPWRGVAWWEMRW